MAIDLPHPDSDGQATRPVRRRVLLAMVLLALLSTLATGLTGCGGRGPGNGSGVIHHVAAGENLYRIGLRYNIPAKEIARANGIRDVTELRVGQRLYIPGARKRVRGSDSGRTASRRDRKGNRAEAQRRAHETARIQSNLQFSWPVRGRLSSRFGMRSGRPP